MTDNQIKVGIFPLSREEMLALGCEYSTVEVSINYEKGGMAGFDWTYRPRAYQLHITPFEAIMRDGKQVGRRSTILGGVGGFLTLEETARKSAKRMEQLAACINLIDMKAAVMAGSAEAMRNAVPVADRSTLKKRDRSGREITAE